MSNPFWYSSTVPLEKFIGRDEEIRNIASKIKTGQSVIISGLPRSGKTSILQYLKNPQTREKLYDDLADKLIFSYLDASTWNNDFNLTQFWQAIFRPLDENLMNDRSLNGIYQSCQHEDFGNYVVERLLRTLKEENWQLIVIIDEFDTVLDISLKGHANFFGTMRSLASESRNSLAIIMAINISHSQLTNKIKITTSTGSPYFNYMTEEMIIGLSDTERSKLLKQGDKYFSEQDYDFIKEMAGSHPYLLQMLASCLWKLYENPELDAAQRYEKATKDFDIESRDTLEKIWCTWESAIQQILRTIALVQLDKLKQAFQRQGIDVDTPSRDIPRFESELELLKKQGIVVEDEKIAGGRRISPKILLHFILDKKLKPEYREILPPEVLEDSLASSFSWVV